MACASEAAYIHTGSTWLTFSHLMNFQRPYLFHISISLEISSAIIILYLVLEIRGEFFLPENATLLLDS